MGEREVVRRARRWARRLVLLGGLGTLEAIGLVVGLLVHLDLRPTRATVAAAVNAGLRVSFEGEITLGRIDRLTPSEIVVGDARVHARDGKTVLAVTEIRARGDWLAALVRIALAGGRGRLRVDDLRAESVDVTLEPDPTGRPTLLSALTPRRKPPDPRQPPKPPRPPALLVDLAGVEVGRLRIGGVIAPGAPIDAVVERLRARMQSDASGVTLELEPASLRETALAGGPTTGAIDALVVAPHAEPARLRARFTGDAAGAPIDASAALDAGGIDVSLAAPRLASPHLERWLGPAAAGVKEPISVRLRVRGAPPAFDVAARVEATGARIEAAGRVSLAGPPLVDATLAADADSPEALVALGLPPPADLAGRLRARGRLRGRLDGAATELRLALSTDPLAFGGHEIPPLEGTAHLGHDRAEAAVHAYEAGSPIDAALRVQGGTLAFAVAATARELGAVPRLRALAGHETPTGQARVRAAGTARRGHVDAALEGELGAVRWPAHGLGVGSARVHGRISGPPGALALDAAVGGAALTVGRARIPRFHLSAQGPLSAPTLRARLMDARERELELRATLAPDGRSLAPVALEIRRGSARLTGRAAAVTSSAGGVSIRGIELAGLGAGRVAGDLAVADGEISGTLSGSDLDVSPLGSLLDLPYPIRGTATLDVRLAAPEGGNARRGRVRLRVQDGGMLIFNDLELDATASLEASSIVPTVTLRMAPKPVGDRADPCTGEILELGLHHAAIALSGSPFDPEAWRDPGAEGTVELEARLACMRELWQQVNPTATLPLDRLDGVLFATATLARKAGDAWPALSKLRLATKDLALAPHTEGEEPSPWRSEDIDVVADGAIDPNARTGSLAVELLGRARGSAAMRFAFARAQVATRALDLAALLGGADRAREALRALPVTASASIPRNSLRALAAMLPPALSAPLAGLGGDATLASHLEGTAARPSAALRLRGWSVSDTATGGDAGRWSLPLDVDVMASYHGGRAHAEAVAMHGARTIGRAEAEAHGDLAAAARAVGSLLGAAPWISPPAEAAWRGRLEARLAGLPLAALPALRALGTVAGEIHGRARIDGLGATPSLLVDLEGREVRVGDAPPVPRAWVRVRRADTPDPAVTLLEGEIRTRGGGRLGVAGYGSLRWREGLLPALDTGEPGGAYVVAERFPLSLARPLLGPDVSKLEGRLDGAVRLGARELAHEEPELGVDLRLTDGVLYVPRVGQELRGIGAHVRSLPGGVVRVDELAAAGPTGRLTGALRARLRGVRLIDMTGELTVPEGEELPLTVEGVPLGSARGTVILRLERGTDDAYEMLLSSVGPLLRLPPSPAHAVQPLDDHPDVILSGSVRPPRLTGGPGPRWRLTVVLDGAEVEGPQLSFVLATHPDRPLRLRSEGGLSGEIVLAAGSIQLLGKAFEIDRCTVRFREEAPGNPDVRLTAHWTAPDGTVVYAEFVGPLQPVTRDKIRFHSQPPRPESDLLALLLFGVEPPQSSPLAAGPTAAEQAGGLGRGLAAAQIGAVLGDVAPGLSTRVGTSQQGYVATSLVYQVSDAVTAAATFERVDLASRSAEASSTSTAPASTPAAGQGARTTLSVDWRFAPRFLVRGSLGVGDEPTSGVDLLFQHRY